jgi:hypothetical protein
VAQVVECLLSKHKALSSTPVLQKKKKNKKKQDSGMAWLPIPKSQLRSQAVVKERKEFY